MVRALRGPGTSTLYLDGNGDGAWVTGTLVALEPRLRAATVAGAAALGALARLVARRRAVGGSAATGVAAVLGYDLFDRGCVAAAGEADPTLLVLEVDAALCFREPGHARLAVSAGPAGRAAAEECCERLLRTLASAAESAPPSPARGCGPPRTSLPRERYLRAAERLKLHIAAGDVYQANLCQQFRVPVSGDVLGLHLELSRRVPAPHGAFVEAAGLALASASPETFLRITPEGAVSTLPIKGTRPRATSHDADRAAALELLASPKDRAELVMIVDLERNDLGRVCEVGSVRVTALAELRSFSAVHHLVARVEGQLRPGLRADDLLRATFPGGSISGAPKLRALQLLHEIEPVRRGFFTGSLVWFGDDGTVDSSILIRSVESSRGEARIGAGGAVVADSEPEAEWRESCDKARAIVSALGFDPEEAR